MTGPARGFPEAEFAGRVARAQALMEAHALDALLLTTDPDLRYFTGFLTRFWESPTRPWFLVLPRTGKPVAVIPSIGALLMGQSWIDDIRCWASPDYDDDGIGLLSERLGEHVGPRGHIGVPDGPETHLRMPLADWARLTATLAPRALTGDAGIVRRLRAVKSEREIARIAQTCAIAGRAFARVPEIAAQGTPLSQVFRAFQALCLDEGADWVAYLAGGAGPGGYGDVISPASDRPLAAGDVLMLDTGAVRDGYFCDFDRNFAVGPVPPATAEGHRRLIEATRAGFAAARPGATAAELHRAISDHLGAAALSGRLGHGLGLQLTEGLSLLPQDHTILEPGMVLTLEPGLDQGGGTILVHEENIAITETGARYLSPPADPDMPVLGAT